MSLNFASPPADISSVRAVIPLPPSLPLKTISLSDASLSILKLLSLLYIEPQCVPPSLRWTVAPASSPSSIIVPSTSNVKSPELSAIVVPSMLMLSISTPASAVILPDGVSVGDNKLDADGNTIPDYQSIDQAKLVPLLVKTIQELEARITTLENA